MRAVITDAEIDDLDLEFRILEEAGFTVTRAQAKTPEQVIAACAGCDAALVQYASFTEEVFDALPDLKVISRFGIGVDSIDLDAARRRGVWVSNVPVYGTDEVPTHTISMLLALARHLPFHDRAIRSGTWHFANTGEFETLSKLTLGVIGMGRLGQQVARLAMPMFGTVVGYDPLLPAEHWPSGVTRLTLEELVMASHAVTLHLPATEATRNMINSGLLSKVRPGGIYLVNTARGGLVDLDDLLRALDEGQVKGVALDVLPEEPPRMDHPILHHPRALVTPHTAWYSRSAMEDLRTKYARNVALWATSGEAPNAVVRGQAQR
ncbi:MAG: hydroxyacid dehydrogenase [Pelagibacterium sp. SCN 64-44]|nr:MAG: hydroxyacid dehydrogenase [Pelagibacterium sp. SCN 64-44]